MTTQATREQFMLVSRETGLEIEPGKTTLTFFETRVTVISWQVPMFDPNDAKVLVEGPGGKFHEVAPVVIEAEVRERTT